ncbi:MAG: hypothetical protein J0H15_01940 [Xanthomonadales bacterium]|nr:hypothetical protein [Xanthomonadales bacterium]
MDPLIVARKLDSLQRCLQRVREKCPENPAHLAADPDLQDIVVLNLSRAVQLCVTGLGLGLPGKLRHRTPAKAGLPTGRPGLRIR